MLSDANQASVIRVFGKPFMLDEEGQDWNVLLDAVREEGRQEAGERERAVMRSCLTVLAAVPQDNLNANFRKDIDRVLDGLRALLAHTDKKGGEQAVRSLTGATDQDLAGWIGWPADKKGGA